MPPKGGNAKKEGGRAKKAENEASKKVVESEQKEKKVVEEWSTGAKSNKASEEKEERRKAEIARKAENARLLAEEESSVKAAKPKPTSKTGGKAVKHKPKPAGPGAIGADAELGDEGAAPKSGDESEEVESYHATGIDNALDLLDVVTAKTDKASMGTQAAGIEKHPERRFKGAYEAYQERELPRLKVDQPGLRLQQYKDVMYKNFQKSPENPFNQTTIAYDATKEDKIAALNAKKAGVEERLKA